jgi:hypothetical protein
MFLSPFPVRQQIIHRLAAPGGLFLGRFERLKRMQCGLDGVQDIRGTKRFGQDIMDSDCLKHGTHTATGNNARTRGSWLEQYDGAAHLGSGLVRDGCLGKMDLVQILAGTIGGFTHGIRHGIGFANTHANLAVIIAHDQCHTELEAAATFHNLRHTRNLNHALIEGIPLLFTFRYL